VTDIRSHAQILTAFDERHGLLKAYSQKLESLLIEVLRDANINVHSVTARVKDRTSLERKLRKPGSAYRDLVDVTDAVGVRITTYLADDVDRIATLIEREFVVDRENSTDKRAIIDPDRFGYLSLHHVVSLTPERVRLTEYRRFPELRAEVQTRSILQHAWAEIEHDLGYKAGEVPKTIRRRFSRLAGLLELADQEFCGIRDELRTYERVVADQITAAPTTVEIDRTSLELFIAQNEIVKDMDRKISSIENRPLGSDSLAGMLVGSLKFFGIDTVAALQQKLAEEQSTILPFAAGWLSGGFGTWSVDWSADQDEEDTADDEDEGSFTWAGISIFYLLYVLVSRAGDVSRVVEYLTVAGIESKAGRGTVAERLVLNARLVADRTDRRNT
jgi:putative GTP pyrophosphokinase